MPENDMCYLRWEDPLQKGMTTQPVLLPGEFCRQRSLVGYSPWGHRSRAWLSNNTWSVLHMQNFRPCPIQANQNLGICDFQIVHRHMKVWNTDLDNIVNLHLNLKKKRSSKILIRKKKLIFNSSLFLMQHKNKVKFEGKHI